MQNDYKLSSECRTNNQHLVVRLFCLTANIYISWIVIGADDDVCDWSDRFGEEKPMKISDESFTSRRPRRYEVVSTEASQYLFDSLVWT